jgi:hypothetical protein
VLGPARAAEIVCQLEYAGFRVLERIDRNWAFGRGDDKDRHLAAGAKR